MFAFLQLNNYTPYAKINSFCSCTNRARKNKNNLPFDSFIRTSAQGNVSFGSKLNECHLVNIDGIGKWYLQQITQKTLDGKTVAVRKIRLKNGAVANVQPKKGYVHSLRNKLNREVTNLDFVFNKPKPLCLSKRLDDDNLKKLQKLKEKDSAKFSLVKSAIGQTMLYEKTLEGVDSEFVSSYIDELISSNTVLLKHLVENNIKVLIFDDKAFFAGINYASYSNTSFRLVSNGEKTRVKKILTEPSIRLAQRNNGKKIQIRGTEVNSNNSFAHELGHMYDYCHNSDKTKANLVSSSDEFVSALEKDFDNITLFDTISGKKADYTLQKILNSPDFKHYLGNVSKNNTSDVFYNNSMARKELFAQAVSYITTGKVANTEFQRKIEILFPNILQCVRRMFEIQ